MQSHLIFLLNRDKFLLKSQTNVLNFQQHSIHLNFHIVYKSLLPAFYLNGSQRTVCNS